MNPAAFSTWLQETIGSFAMVLLSAFLTSVFALTGQIMPAVGSAMMMIGAFSTWARRTADHLLKVMTGAMVVAGTTSVQVGSEVLGVIALLLFIVPLAQA